MRNFILRFLTRLSPNLWIGYWAKRTILVVDKVKDHTVLRRIGTIIGLTSNKRVICRDIETEEVFFIPYSDCYNGGSNTLFAFLSQVEMK